MPTNPVNYQDTIDSFLSALKQYSRRHGGNIRVFLCHPIEYQIEHFGTLSTCELWFHTSRTVHNVYTKRRTWLTMEVSKYALFDDKDLYRDPKIIRMSYDQAKTEGII